MPSIKNDKLLNVHLNTIVGSLEIFLNYIKDFPEEDKEIVGDYLSEKIDELEEKFENTVDKE